VGLLTRAVTIERLGLVGYREAWALQNELHDKRVAGDIGDTLLLLEHPHVYTIGRRGNHEDVLRPDVEVVETDRGGQVTYHGPGQLVGYPIVDLGPGADLVRYVRRLEDVMIDTLAHFGIMAGRDEGNTGVWVGNAKIGAIGVRVTRNVTKHGFALNVATDLSYFTGIIPCGITDKGVTSMHVLGSDASLIDVSDVVAGEFTRVFGYV
jgi:lipoyl(octanoyl) transferase